MEQSYGIAEDLGWASALACGAVVAVYALVLVLELVRHGGTARWVALSGLLGVLALALCLFRPVRVVAQKSVIGPRVTVLVDRSRRLLLPEGDTTRDAIARDAARDVVRALPGARLSVLGFGEGAAARLALDDATPPRFEDSDLEAALAALGRATGERAEAVIVVSDGRLTRPGTAAGPELERLVGALGVPIHTVSVAERAPPDAAVRAIHTAGSAVAHQPFALRLEIACSGGLDCQEVPVVVRELRRNAEPAVLATGVAKLDGEELATLELQITIERAGPRVIEISIDAPSGDRVADNDRRIVTFNVARQRVRLLHVAGRPTYDVRALRMWLKSDESVDLVAFFILRTDTDDPLTRDESELALIPFPVDELFTEHLASFDAVVLQDIDAVAYRLSRHLPALERYVRSGGGLVMVGGPSAFAGGGYARSPLERILPVEIGSPEHPFDLGELVPRYTDAGRAAPVLAGLRDLVGEDLPRMVGSNSVGRARPGAMVLWEHPTLRASDKAVPLLALGDAGDGRAVALAVDGTHELAFSRFAEHTAGRAYGALWDGLLGWLMRQPRYEAVRTDLVGPCIARDRARLRLTRLPGAGGEAQIEVRPLAPGSEGANDRAAGAKAVFRGSVEVPPSGVAELELGKLEPGGYVAEARIGQAPATRLDFACERGGQSWGDTRPDPERLAKLSSASGGRSVRAANARDLPAPPPTEVAAERDVTPILPPWTWALGAAALLGWHWIERRRTGLV